MATQSRLQVEKVSWGLAYAWAGIGVMWLFWTCFVVFLSSPGKLRETWPLPMVDQGGAVTSPWLAAVINICLISLFGLQHSVMARPWFKATVMQRLPPAFERCTYVHMANTCLFALIIFWQPISLEVWNVGTGIWRDIIWILFALGWITLFAGAWSFGIFDLLGLKQMRAWQDGRRSCPFVLKTGRLYRWVSHPMYVGVLLGVWATPRMTAGQLLLAVGFTAYVLIAMQYEKRDLARRYGARYEQWRHSS
jgi:hypothetical protein